MPHALQHPLPYAALFFDADDTLRRCLIPGQPCPNKPGEYELLPNVRETLALYDWTKVGVSVVSNQGGVALGFLTEAMARFLLQETLALATGTPVGIKQVLLCPHAPRAGCDCRKPHSKLLVQAETFWHSQGLLHGPGQCVYIGDQPTDQAAAQNAGIDFLWAHEFFGWDEAPAHYTPVR